MSGNCSTPGQGAVSFLIRGGLHRFNLGATGQWQPGAVDIGVLGDFPITSLLTEAEGCTSRQNPHLGLADFNVGFKKVVFSKVDTFGRIVVNCSI